MFDGLAGYWVPVELADRVGAQTHSVRVASEQVQLTRSAGGLRATVTLRGERASRELPLDATWAGGLVYVFTDPRGDGARRPPADHEAAAPSTETWAMPWDRAMARLLLEPHLAFGAVEPAGRALARWLRPETITDVDEVATPVGPAVRWRVRGEAGYAELAWIRPNGLRWQLAGDGFAASGRVHCVPVDEDATRLFVTTLGHGSGPPGAAVLGPLEAPADALVTRFRRWHLRYGARSTAPAPHHARSA